MTPTPSHLMISPSARSSSLSSSASSAGAATAPYVGGGSREPTPLRMSSSSDYSTMTRTITKAMPNPAFDAPEEEQDEALGVKNHTAKPVWTAPMMADATRDRTARTVLFSTSTNLPRDSRQDAEGRRPEEGKKLWMTEASHAHKNHHHSSSAPLSSSSFFSSESRHEEGEKVSSMLWPSIAANGDHPPLESPTTDCYSRPPSRRTLRFSRRLPGEKWHELLQQYPETEAAVHESVRDDVLALLRYGAERYQDLTVEAIQTSAADPGVLAVSFRVSFTVLDADDEKASPRSTVDHSSLPVSSSSSSPSSLTSNSARLRRRRSHRQCRPNEEDEGQFDTSEIVAVEEDVEMRVRLCRFPLLESLRRRLTREYLRHASMDGASDRHRRRRSTNSANSSTSTGSRSDRSHRGNNRDRDREEDDHGGERSRRGRRATFSSSSSSSSLGGGTEDGKPFSLPAYDSMFESSRAAGDVSIPTMTTPTASLGGGFDGGESVTSTLSRSSRRVTFSPSLDIRFPPQPVHRDDGDGNDDVGYHSWEDEGWKRARAAARRAAAQAAPGMEEHMPPDSPASTADPSSFSLRPRSTPTKVQQGSQVVAESSTRRSHSALILTPPLPREDEELTPRAQREAPKPYPLSASALSASFTRPLPAPAEPVPVSAPPMIRGRGRSENEPEEAGPRPRARASSSRLDGVHSSSREGRTPTPTSRRPHHSNTGVTKKDSIAAVVYAGNDEEEPQPQPSFQDPPPMRPQWMGSSEFPASLSLVSPTTSSPTSWSQSSSTTPASAVAAAASLDHNEVSRSAAVYSRPLSLPADSMETRRKAADTLPRHHREEKSTVNNTRPTPFPLPQSKPQPLPFTPPTHEQPAAVTPTLAAAPTASDTGHAVNGSASSVPTVVPQDLKRSMPPSRRKTPQLASRSSSQRGLLHVSISPPPPRTATSTSPSGSPDHMKDHLKMGDSTTIAVSDRRPENQAKGTARASTVTPPKTSPTTTPRRSDVVKQRPQHHDPHGIDAGHFAPTPTTIPTTEATEERLAPKVSPPSPPAPPTAKSTVQDPIPSAGVAAVSPVLQSSMQRGSTTTAMMKPKAQPVQPKAEDLLLDNREGEQKVRHSEEDKIDKEQARKSMSIPIGSISPFFAGASLPLPPSSSTEDAVAATTGGRDIDDPRSVSLSSSHLPASSPLTFAPPPSGANASPAASPPPGPGLHAALRSTTVSCEGPFIGAQSSSSSVPKNSPNSSSHVSPGDHRTSAEMGPASRVMAQQQLPNTQSLMGRSTPVSRGPSRQTASISPQRYSVSPQQNSSLVSLVHAAAETLHSPADTSMVVLAPSAAMSSFVELMATPLPQPVGCSRVGSESTGEQEHPTAATATDFAFAGLHPRSLSVSRLFIPPSSRASSVGPRSTQERPRESRSHSSGFAPMPVSAARPAMDADLHQGTSTGQYDPTGTEQAIDEMLKKEAEWNLYPRVHHLQQLVMAAKEEQDQRDAAVLEPERAALGDHSGMNGDGPEKRERHNLARDPTASPSVTGNKAENHPRLRGGDSTSPPAGVRLFAGNHAHSTSQSSFQSFAVPPTVSAVGEGFAADRSGVSTSSVSFLHDYGQQPVAAKLVTFRPPANTTTGRRSMSMSSIPSGSVNGGGGISGGVSPTASGDGAPQRRSASVGRHRRPSPQRAASSGATSKANATSAYTELPDGHMWTPSASRRPSQVPAVGERAAGNSARQSDAITPVALTTSTTSMTWDAVPNRTTSPTSPAESDFAAVSPPLLVAGHCGTTVQSGMHLDVEKLRISVEDETQEEKDTLVTHTPTPTRKTGEDTPPHLKSTARGGEEQRAQQEAEDQRPEARTSPANEDPASPGSLPSSSIMSTSATRSKPAAKKSTLTTTTTTNSITGSAPLRQKSKGNGHPVSLFSKGSGKNRPAGGAATASKAPASSCSSGSPPGTPSSPFGDIATAAKERAVAMANKLAPKRG